MCTNTPTSMSITDSGRSHQFPNPSEEISIKEPSSLSQERIVLNHIDEPEDQEMMEIIVCKGNLRVSEKKKIMQFNNLLIWEMKNGVIGEQKLTTNIKLSELAAKIISRNDPSNASKQKTLSLGMKKRKRDAKRLKNLIANVTEHVKALEKQANKTELSNPDELENDDNPINFNFETENILDQILEKPVDNTEPNNPDNNSFDELRWIELELENEDNQIDFNEVKGSDMIKEDANIENC